MIAIDSSVLIRHLTGDEPTQSHLADRFFQDRIAPDRPGYVSIVVLLETLWALRTGFRYGPGEVLSVAKALLDAPQLVVGDAALVRRALAGDASVGLADRIIHELGRAAGCTETVTFDRKFARLPGVRLLAD